MTITNGAITASLIPTEEYDALIDRSRCLETEVTRQMAECDALRSCVTALQATVAELQRAVKEMA